MIPPTHQAKGQPTRRASPAFQRETPSKQRNKKTAAAGKVRLDFARYINANRIRTSVEPSRGQRSREMKKLP